MLQAAQRPYLENRHAIPVRVCKKVLDTYIFEKATLPHWIRECTIFELSSMYIYVEDIFALDKGPGLRFRRPCGPMSPSMRSSTSYLRANDYQLLIGVVVLFGFDGFLNHLIKSAQSDMLSNSIMEPHLAGGPGP